MEGDAASGGSAPTLVGCDVEVLDELDEVWRRARVLETVGKQHRLLFEGQTVVMVGYALITSSLRCACKSIIVLLLIYISAN